MNYLLWQGALRSAHDHPDRLAVQDGEQVLTYRELAEQSARLAALLATWGVGRHDRVAIWLPKGGRAVVAMLGVSRSGAAYVPVDPAAPAGRAITIIRNAGARVLVTTSRLLAEAASLHDTGAVPDHVLLVDAEADDPGTSTSSWSAVTTCTSPLPFPASVESDPAYILYTSGSTGTPKGVVISHRNALTFIEWAAELCALTPDDRLSNHAPFHFDLSVFDIYAAFHSGACVVLVPATTALFPVQLAQWIAAERITVWYSVPSALTRLQKQGEVHRFSYGALRTVLFAGEVFPVKHLGPVMDTFDGADFYNLYGPTETNVCTYYPVPRPLPEDLAELPIGAPCANYEAFALTDNGAVALDGEEGELLVRGPGVMLGYWGLPELTRRVLAQHPLHENFVDFAYRTGDIVRRQADGSFAFLGRRDHMVKTRGYRVELGEVEHVLNLHECVAGAAVIAVSDDEVGARLWAAVVAESGVALAQAQLVDFCRQRLPHYAIPERFLFLDDLPRTSTGKVDRQSLASGLSANNAEEVH